MGHTENPLTLVIAEELNKQTSKQKTPPESRIVLSSRVGPRWKASRAAGRAGLAADRSGPRAAGPPDVLTAQRGGSPDRPRLLVPGENGFGYNKQVAEIGMPFHSVSPSPGASLPIFKAVTSLPVLVPGPVCWTFLFHWCAVWPGQRDHLKSHQGIQISNKGDKICYPKMCLSGIKTIWRNVRCRSSSENTRSYP